MSRREEVMSTMEETRKRKVILTAEEHREASSAGDQQSAIVPEEHEKISIVVHETATSHPQMTHSLEEKFKSIREEPVKTPDSHIYRVPLLLHDTKDYKKYFEPRVVSVGPYHHGKNKQLKLAEPLKLQSVRMFIKKEKENGERNLYDLIFKKIQSLRECYDDTLTKMYNDEELAWMLFVDGCCVLHYIQCYLEGQFNDLYIKDHHISFVLQDLFLLENQLPFEVLKLLMDEIFPQGEGMKKIDEFIREYLNLESGTGAKKKWPWTMSFFPKTTSTGENKDPNVQNTNKKQPSHLLELLRRAYVINNKPTVPQEKGTTYPWQSFRSVSELTAKGILLTPSDSNRVTDIDFLQHFYAGELKLPRITIDDSTKAKLLNLIALEMCLDSKNHHYEVTSYVCFLDSLIDNPKDVRELRDAGILYNMLGADEEVSTLFNEITTDLVPNNDIYKKVKFDIEKHCENKFYKWVAQGLYTHFDSPWTILAFLAAVLALVLSAVQTYYAIKAVSNDCDGLCKYLKKALNLRN